MLLRLTLESSYKKKEEEENWHFLANGAVFRVL